MNCLPAAGAAPGWGVVVLASAEQLRHDHRCVSVCLLQPAGVSRQQQADDRQPWAGVSRQPVPSSCPAHEPASQQCDAQRTRPAHRSASSWHRQRGSFHDPQLLLARQAARQHCACAGERVHCQRLRGVCHQGGRPAQLGCGVQAAEAEPASRCLPAVRLQRLPAPGRKSHMSTLQAATASRDHDRCTASAHGPMQLGGSCGSWWLTLNPAAATATALRGWRATAPRGPPGRAGCVEPAVCAAPPPSLLAPLGGDGCLLSSEGPLKQSAAHTPGAGQAKQCAALGAGQAKPRTAQPAAY